MTEPKKPRLDWPHATGELTDDWVTVNMQLEWDHATLGLRTENGTLVLQDKDEALAQRMSCELHIAVPAVREIIQVVRLELSEALVQRQFLRRYEDDGKRH